jgi:hypothetical protein
MSRGLGSLQSEIKTVLSILWKHRGSMRFADLRAGLLYAHGGEEGDTLAPTYERSVWRALNKLIARGDVVVIGGKGTSSSPREYMAVEDFARLAGQVRSTADAKKIAAGAKGFEAMVVAAVRLQRAAARGV